MERPSTRISASVIGAPDPRLLGHFYSDLLGWPITEEQDGWVMIKPPGGGTGLSFQLEDDYRAPVWPPQPGAPADDVPPGHRGRGSRQGRGLGARSRGAARRLPAPGPHPRHAGSGRPPVLPVRERFDRGPAVVLAGGAGLADGAPSSPRPGVADGPGRRRRRPGRIARAGAVLVGPEPVGADRRSAAIRAGPRAVGRADPGQAVGRARHALPAAGPRAGGVARRAGHDDEVRQRDGTAHRRDCDRGRHGADRRGTDPRATRRAGGGDHRIRRVRAQCAARAGVRTSKPRRFAA